MSAMASLTTLNASAAAGVSAGASAVEAAAPGAGRVLPTRTELAAVLPWPGLRRGSTVAVHGSVSLVFALLSEATRNGSWAAVVGLPGISLVAASECGVDLDRLAMVPRPGGDPVGVVAALLDGVDLVVVGNTRQVSDQDARRLSARARNLGSVLLPFGAWPGAEVQLRCVGASWHGIGEGHGHLRERAVTVRSRGRGAAARPRSCRLLLPARDGSIGLPAEDRGVRPRLRPVAG
ncbi:hypothetical protein GCM10011581_14300 [Saccharopolyspora subtropica]|uniref:Recombinase A n=1 Tax=Saccharopolyspora thermophila TaxID=89367 RepID=A0A917N902_9PSEU|nr:hypothetical protein [Saccharopolyspora subtropica]GGI78344.1 hypothetical protein GCM10011581_14300 [Saccharopolyspora subtropica]